MDWVGGSLAIMGRANASTISLILSVNEEGCKRSMSTCHRGKVQQQESSNVMLHDDNANGNLEVLELIC